MPVPMRLVAPWRSRVGALFLGFSLIAAPARAQSDPSFFDEGKAQAALEQIFDKAGQPKRALSLEISAYGLIVAVQDPAAPKHVDAWTDVLSTGRWRWVYPEKVSGPEPVDLNLPNPDLEANLFDLKPADAAPVPALIAAAIKRAALEDPATEAKLTLKRQLRLIPEPSSGPPGWTIELSSGREHATIYADMSGRITHGNFDGTRRAQTLDYLSGGADFDAAVALIVDVIGKDAVIRSISVDPHRIGFEAPNPEHPERFSRYSAGLNGVYRDLISDSFANVKMPGEEKLGRFAIAEVDWRLLTKLQEAARRQLGLPGGRITGITLSKPNTGAGDPQVQWEIAVKSATDTAVDGRVVFDAAGKVLHTRYPPGKGPKLDLFDADGYAAAVAALKASLGDHAAVVELRFDRDRLLATVKDPRDPKAQTVFEYHGEALSRSILPPLDWPTFGPDWFFDLAAITAAPARWAQLQQDTLARLGMADAKIDRITISKQKLMMPRNDRVLIEIRADEGKREGRVVYDLAGKPVDIVKP
jgi:hypothetical protein